MEKTNFITNIFHTMDIFGKKTEFQIDHKPKFTTLSGGLFSMIYFGCIFFFFFSFGGDMINRVNPDTNVSQIFQRSPSRTSISKNSYFFMFGLQDTDGNQFIDEQIYTVSFFQSMKTTMNGNTNYSNIDIPLEPCTLENLPDDPNLSEYFKNVAGPLENMYCVKKGYDDQFYMESSWDQPQFSMIQLFLTPCMNSTDRVCKSPEVINQKLKSGYFAYYSLDNLFDMMDYSKPAKTYGRDYYIQTTNSVKKVIVRQLKTNHILTNDGWIVDLSNEKDVYSFDTDRESFELLSETTAIIDFSIRKSNYESILSRKYKKIQNVFAEMTGFLQIIFLFLWMVSNPFIQKEYYETLTNSIYNFELDESENVKKQTKKQKKKFNQNVGKKEDRIKTLKTMINTHIEGTESVCQSQQKITSKQKKDNNMLVNYMLKLQEKPLNLSIKDNLKSLFVHEPNLDMKKNQRKTGIQNIFSQLDIRFVLKKFAEIDKLKMLLLNEDQYHLFDYLPKPVILTNSKIHINYARADTKSPLKKSEIIHENNDMITKAKTVQKAYLNIISKNERTEIDRKLIESLDEDIIRILDAGELLRSENKIPIQFGSPTGVKTSMHHDSIISENAEDQNRKDIELKYSQEHK